MKRNDLKILAFLEGVGVLLIQLIAAQMLAPQFGANLYTWGAVLGSSSLGLALGYLHGSKTSKHTKQSHIYWRGLIGGLAISTMPMIAKILINSTYNIEPISGSILVCILLILPPIILLSSLPILIINHETKNSSQCGNNTGNIYSISTLGGIIGLLIGGYLTIPAWGLTYNAIFIGCTIALFCIFHLTKERKTIIAFLLIPIIYFEFKYNQPPKALHYSEGLLGQITVIDNKSNNTRGLFVNRMGQTLINIKTNKSEWEYPKYIYKIAKQLPANSDILLIGLGGGTIANHLQEKLSHNVTAIELDQRIPNLAKSYFYLSDNIRTISDDGRHYLEKTKNKFDLIIFDVLKGETPPHQLLTIEAFQKAISTLNKKGFIIVNYNGFTTGNKGKATRAIYRTLIKTNINTTAIATSSDEYTRNCMFFCSMTNLNLTDILIKNDEDITILINKKDLTTSEPQIILEDNKPNLEILNLAAAKEWRNGYLMNYFENEKINHSAFY